MDLGKGSRSCLTNVLAVLCGQSYGGAGQRQECGCDIFGFC